MAVRHLDPTLSGFGLAVPGGDMFAIREDESTSILYSYGILRVLMYGSGGEPLQLADGTKSTLVMTIPDEQLQTAPSTIPLWYFDEEVGIWKEEGFAEKIGDQYIGDVAHFTDWNCDKPEEYATIIGRLLDCSGNPAWGTLEAGQIALEPQILSETGEHDGTFEIDVPARTPVTLTFTDPLVITPLTKDGRGKVIVIVPPLAPEQVYDVGDVQVFPCPTYFSATVNTATNDDIEYAMFYSDNGSKALFDPTHVLETTLPPDMSITLRLTTASGITYIKTFTTPGPGETIDLGVIDLTTSNNVEITGTILCNDAPVTQAQISFSWEESPGNQETKYAIPNEEGKFTFPAPFNTNVTVEIIASSGSWQQSIETPATDNKIDLGEIELCKEGVVGETSFRITGDGFNNKLISIFTSKNSREFNYAIYAGGTEKATSVYVNDVSDTIAITVVFSGNTTGVKNQSSSLVRIEKFKGQTVKNEYYEAGLGFPNTTLLMEVTAYDEVGGVVEGTFSGTFQEKASNGTPTGTSVTITEGKFSALRYPDLF